LMLVYCLSSLFLKFRDAVKCPDIFMAATAENSISDINSVSKLLNRAMFMTSVKFVCLIQITDRVFKTATHSTGRKPTDTENCL
jgi:hypothetical protein